MGAYPSAVPPLRNPITGIAGCCARAASGNATAAPPSAASNSRRPMVTVIRPSRARRVKETIPRHEGAVFIFKEGAVAPQPPPRLQQRLFLRRLDRVFDIFHGRELDVPELAVHPFNPAHIDVANDITRFRV